MIVDEVALHLKKNAITAANQPNRKADEIMAQKNNVSAKFKRRKFLNPQIHDLNSAKTKA